MKEMSVEVTQAKKQEYTARVSYFDELSQKQVSIFLCSRIDPVKEGEKWADSIYDSKKRNFLIYGFGMGYHIKALVERLTADQRVYVIDVNKRIQDEIKKQCNVQFIEDVRCKILVTDQMNEIEGFLTSISSEDTLVQMYLPCVKIIPTSHKRLKELFQSYKVRQSGNKVRELVVENYNFNHKGDFPNISSWYDKIQKKPVIIVSGGPSLEKNIDQLKSVQDEVFIFASGRTLKLLINKGIRVHMFCIIDPTYELIYKQIEGVEDANIPLVFLDTANYKVVNAYKGPKFIAYSEEANKEQEGRVESGGSVATVMLDLAIRMGGNPIIFIGQDLAYTGLKSHCQNEISLECVEQDVNMKKVKSVSGEYIPTTLALLSFKWWIERKIRKTKGVKFINATEGGAYIKGCEHRTLESVLNQYRG